MLSAFLYTVCLDAHTGCFAYTPYMGPNQPSCFSSSTGRASAFEAECVGSIPSIAGFFYIKSPSHDHVPCTCMYALCRGGRIGPANLVAAGQIATKGMGATSSPTPVMCGYTDLGCIVPTEVFQMTTHHSDCQTSGKIEPREPSTE